MYFGPLHPLCLAPVPLPPQPHHTSHLLSNFMPLFYLAHQSVLHDCTCVGSFTWLEWSISDFPCQEKQHSLSVTNSDPWLLSQECDVRKSLPLRGEIFSTHDLVEALNKVITIVVCSCVCVCVRYNNITSKGQPFTSSIFHILPGPCHPMSSGPWRGW